MKVARTRGYKGEEKAPKVLANLLKYTFTSTSNII
jgi:hypothetical protein